MLGKATVGIIFLLLVWGNMVAGLKAGLACPDWPLCHGRVVPPFRLDIYMEFGHRVIAAVSGVLLATLSYTRFRAYRGAARAVPAGALVLLAVEIVMGGLVVLLELPVQLTTLHFAGGLVIFVLAFYMMRFDGVSAKPAFPAGGASLLFMGLGMLVLAQAALGAYVRHSGAGLACPDWPACLGGLVPPVMDAGVLAHYSHRILAYLIALTMLALHASARLDRRFRANRGTTALLLGLVVLQVGAGAAVVYSELYFATTALHLALALAMLYVVAGMWAEESRQREAAR